MAITTLRLSNILCEQSPKNGANILGIAIKTWTRDSHDLFDYEASQLNSDSLRVMGQSVELLRKGNDVIAIPSDEPVHLDAEYLVSVRFDKLSGHYVVSSRDSPYLHSSVSGRKLWSVIRENNPHGCVLREGDIVKLGRFRLRVRQICLTDKASEEDNTSCSSYNGEEEVTVRKKDSRLSSNRPDLRVGNHSTAFQFAPSFDLGSSTNNPALMQLQCRICLSEGPQEGDPLLCPCECSGSIGYVHSDCIGKWLRGRLGLENHTKAAFFYRPMACELCHATYPPYWRNSSDKQASLVDDSFNHVAFLPDTRPPFIVFENLGGSAVAPAWSSDSSNTFPHGLHIVSLSNPTGVKIGRGHDCEMRISDVSISRQHALVKVGEDGNVYLFDQQSKFGTLVALDRDEKTVIIPQKDAQSMSIQCGRTVLSFTAVGSPENASSPRGDVTSVHSTFNDGSDYNDEMDDVDVADEQEFPSHFS